MRCLWQAVTEVPRAWAHQRGGFLGEQADDDANAFVAPPQGSGLAAVLHNKPMPVPPGFR